MCVGVPEFKVHPGSVWESTLNGVCVLTVCLGEHSAGSGAWGEGGVKASLALGRERPECCCRLVAKGNPTSIRGADQLAE